MHSIPPHKPSFSTTYAKHWLICSFIALLAACGSQEGINTDTAVTNNALTATKSIVNSENNTDASAKDTNSTLLSTLLASLAQLYPNGQLPAERAAQAAQDLAQNPAALLLTSAAASRATEQQPSLSLDPQALSADYQPVKRVQNTTLYGAYFFSIYPTEITTALATNPNWSLEGPAFWASLATGTDLYPVHRFRNLFNGSYLYTIYETERADIAANYAATFTYEGVAWYARQTPATGWSALYRFRNKTNGTYLFSAYESEKNAIVANYPDVFALEGIAYYVRQDAPVVASPISIGIAHTCALKADGTVSCWGRNNYGQLGDGTITNRLSPTAVPSLTGVAAVSAGDNHSCVLKTDGTVRCWGNNLYGQLGDGTTTDRVSPTAVPGLTGVVALSAGGYHNCAVKADGTVSCWGYNGNGGLGDGSTTNRLSPTAVPSLTGVATMVTGYAHSCAVKTDGTVRCWGNNLYGQLGDGSTTTRLNPTAVPGLTGVADISAGNNHSCAVKSNGTASCWGLNAYGQLGDSSATNRLSPTSVTSLTGAIAIASGFYHSCAFKTDGTASCWGDNINGGVGDGSTTNRLSPTAVASLTGVAAIAAGGFHSCALKTDGVVRCWGSNAYGQLGDGSTTDRLSNVDVLGGPVFWK